MGPTKLFSKIHNHLRGRSRSRSRGGDSVEGVRTAPSTPNAALTVLETERESSSVIAGTHQEASQGQLVPVLTVTRPVADLGSSSEPAIACETEKPPPTRAEIIWDCAYDELKAEKAELVQTYEKILSCQLQGDDVTFEALESGRNVIEQHDKDKRRNQMHQLVDAGLKKIETELKVKETLGTVIETVIPFKDMISTAIKDAPQAALPWAAVSLSLEFLANPVTQTRKCCEGVQHVIKSMNWYHELAGHLIKDNREDDNFAGAQRELQIRLTDLYKELLSFEMRSICYFYRHRLGAFLRDLIKLDDWDGSVEAVEEAEAYFRHLGHELTAIKSESHLEQIVASTKRQEEYQKTEKDVQCLRDLYITDPRIDKSRIENTKGGLFQDSFCWILENPEFKTWLENEQGLLWLRGDPGKGKTMLLCGIIDYLRKKSSILTSLFFCQATVPSINNHLAVLRGLIWLFADQQPRLISHIRKKYDPVGKEAFDDFNAWYTLSGIFSDILLDDELRTTYVIIDALDECTTGLTELLDLIHRVSASASSNVKWIVSSRNWPEIENKLTGGVGLSLEVNAALVSASVDAYISHKASQISFLEQDDHLKEEVCSRIRQRANGTFLWVAIVFKRLQDMEDAQYDEQSEVLEILDEIPDDLSGLYSVMLEQINKKGKGPERCRAVLAITTLAHRPLHLLELAVLAGFKGNLAKVSQMGNLIKKCGSFLTVRDNKVYFIHQTAKEYLSNHITSQSVLFPAGTGEILLAMVTHSLTAMRATLRQNIYGLDSPATLIGDIRQPDADPLESVRYSCVDWMGHLCDTIIIDDGPRLQDILCKDGLVLSFLKEHFLHWLEVVSLTRYPSGGILDIRRLESLLKKKNSSSDLLEFVYDARRFVQQHSWIIENAPLQIYLSGILFSPTKSIIRTLFEQKLHSWIKTKPAVEDTWSPCLQTIEIGDPFLAKVAVSNDKILASHPKSNNLSIWDIASGKQVQELETTSYVRHAVFSMDSNRIIAQTEKKALSWDVRSGALVENYNLPDVREFVFSNNGRFAAMETVDETILIRDFATRKELHSIKVIGVRYLHALSDNARFLAFCEESYDCNCDDDRNADHNHITVWDAEAGTTRIRLPKFDLVHFSGDFKLLALLKLNYDKVIMWDLDAKKQIRILYQNKESFQSIKISPDSNLVAGMGLQSICVWDVATGKILHRFSYNYIGSFWYLYWSSDGRILVSQAEREIKIWDLSLLKKAEAVAIDQQIILTSTGEPILDIVFSNGCGLVASITNEGTVTIWDTTSSRVRQTFNLSINYYRLRARLAFSPNASFVYIADGIGGFQKCDIASGLEIQHRRSCSHIDGRTAVAFSIDGRLFAEENDKGVRVWDLASETLILDQVRRKDEDGYGYARALAFSNDAKYLASLWSSGIIIIRDTTTGLKIWELNLQVCPHSDKEVRGWKCCPNAIHNDLLFPASFGILDLPEIAVSDDGLAVLYKDEDHYDWVLRKEQEGILLGYMNAATHLSFDVNTSSVIRRLKRINLNSILEGREYVMEGYGLSDRGDWISWNGKNILWLPTDYRPHKYGQTAMSSDYIAFETASHRLFMIGFSGQPSF